MSKIRLAIFMSLVAVLVAYAPVAAFTPAPPLGVNADGVNEGPGGVPHYFGPYGNWAFSPLPMGPVKVVNVVAGGTGYSATPTVTVLDAYITPTTPAVVTAAVVGGVIQGFTINNPGADYIAPVVIITDPTGTGALADAVIGPPVGGFTTGMRKFVDKMAGLGSGSANALGQYIPIAVADTTTYPGADYYEIAIVEYEEQMHSDLPPTRMRGYVQLSTPVVPGAFALLNLDGTPILKPDGTPAVGVDKPHYLGPTIVAQGRVHGIEATNPDAGKPVPVRIKFYNLLPTGTGGNLFIPVDESVPGSGIGPALPGGAGSKYTQNRAAIHLHGNNTVWISDGNVHQWFTPANENTPYPKGVSVRNVPDMGNECDAANSGCMTFFYTNAQSARLQFYHDHAMGITRLNVYAGMAGGYVLTDAVEKDMVDGSNVSGVNPGRLKVLPPDNFGLGIPLIIQDKTWVDPNTIYAQDPTWNSGTNPGDLWYPHVYMSVQNPWDTTGTNAFGRWHYGPWFNPPTPTCDQANPIPGCVEVGPVPNPYYQAICDTNPADPACTAPWEPPMRPGVPNPSIPGESFLDTPLVNGTAYPYLEVEPRAYRFRVLNAANDRFLNLQLYVAADKTFPTTADTDYTLTPAALCDPDSVPPSPGPVGNCTEVKMVPVSVAPANQFADTPSGIPDPTTAGPPWILIGTEGGFMPKPVVVPQQPIGWNVDMAYFAFGIINQHSLFLGTAERADVVVDFSQYAGKTLILYNDSPAPVPAGAAPYDFYTGNGNQMDGGGAPNTQPGYGPNTRTIMQIRVGTEVTTPTTDVTLANLQAVFAKALGKRGVFEVSQDPIIIPQAAYNSAYDASFPTSAAAQYLQIADTQKTFNPLTFDSGTTTWSQQTTAVTLPLEMKAMHDEMGGVYDTLFGRMSGMLGLSLPNSAIHVLIPYGLAAPPTDLVMGSIEGTPIGVMPDGTQIWRIFHNGVDTHTIHTHLFHTQLINRVDQSGQRVGDPVDPIEHGWKDTFRVNPLEVTFLAMRPTVPTPSQVPFEVPNSIRLIDPTLPEGATLIPPPPAGWFDPAGNQIEPEILNHYVNFGWEYVWHCHILSHEEMDMMHSLVFAIPPIDPTGLTAAVNGNNNNLRVDLSWTDNSLNETQFTIQRATNSTFTQGLTTLPPLVNNVPTVPNPVTYSDPTVANNSQYWYRVFATNVVGDTQTYTNSIGFPTISANSNPLVSERVVVGTPPTAPAAPTNLAAALRSPTATVISPQVRLTWRDNATNETGFVVERCTGAGCNSFAVLVEVGPRTTGSPTVTYDDATVTAGNTYRYQVKAINLGGSSGYSGPASVTVPPIPTAPASFIVGPLTRQGNSYSTTLTWSYTGANPSNFTIQRANNLDFTTGLTAFTAAGSARSLSQTLSRNTVYYFRIRANNTGGSSAWVNAQPFPIRTGP